MQQALAPYYLIKLDLSHYDASSGTAQSMGHFRPIFIFRFKNNKKSVRLRLTGAFKK